MAVLVTGVNGRIGGLLAARAHAAGLEVIGASGHPERTGPRPYELRQADLNRPETLRPVLAGVTAAFVYPAAGAIDQLVAELHRAELQHVVVMTSSAVVLPGAARLAGQFHQVEDAVRAADLPWTLLRPDAFASNTEAWAPELRERGQVSLPYPEAHVVPVHEDDIVDAALAALTDDRHVRTAYLLTGPESMTQREQVGTIARELGREVPVVGLSREQWRSSVEGRMPAFVADALLDLWAAADHVPQPTDRTVQRVTGQRPRTFAQWVGEHRDVFSGSR
jgi:uncharacterized protein YbjT (DUF2867 family)